MKRTFFAALFLTILMAVTAFAQNKTALLIANGDYQNFSSLANPVPEARQLRSALQRLGFQVTLLTDADKEEMIIGLRNFQRSVKSRGGVAFFHYGGHAVQVGGKNYLIPANADIPDEDYVSLRAMDAEEIMVSLEHSGSDSNIVILDSCRNNPLPAGSGRSASRGLAVVGKEPPNTVIVYSAKSGQVARDGVFTPALTRALTSPGLSIQEILMQTRQKVYEQTKGAQIPGEYNQLFEPVYLAGRGSSGGGNNISFGAVTVEPGSLTINVVEAGTLEINGQSVQIPSGGSIPVNGLDPGSYILSMQYGNGLRETKTVEVESGISKSIAFSYVVRTSTVSRMSLDDSFVLVKAGSFTMGSPSNEPDRKDNEAQHQVTLTRDFYISKYEVTQGLWKEVMGNNPSEVSTGIDVNYPVNEISWIEAVDFCNKLSRRQGLNPVYSGSGDSIRCDFNANGYRLPTEAEWEFAARGAQSLESYQIYAGSNSLGNVGWFYNNSGGKNHAVGQKSLNPLGLYDMSGNVFEWCWDWYGNYSGTVINPTGDESGSYRVTRGGSWLQRDRFNRSAFRDFRSPYASADDVGFRLVRTAN